MEAGGVHVCATVGAGVGFVKVDESLEAGLVDAVAAGVLAEEHSAPRRERVVADATIAPHICPLCHLCTTFLSLGHFFVGGRVGGRAGTGAAGSGWRWWAWLRGIVGELAGDLLAAHGGFDGIDRRERGGRGRRVTQRCVQDPRQHEEDVLAPVAAPRRPPLRRIIRTRARPPFESSPSSSTWIGAINWTRYEFPVEPSTSKVMFDAVERQSTNRICCRNALSFRSCAPASISA